jgi:hypothetical protein
MALQNVKCGLELPAVGHHLLHLCLLQGSKAKRHPPLEDGYYHLTSLNKLFISIGDVSCHLKFRPKITAYSTTVVIFSTHYCICAESSCFKMWENVFSSVILNKFHSICYKCSGRWSLTTNFWLAWLGIWSGKGRFTGTK